MARLEKRFYDQGNGRNTSFSDLSRLKTNSAVFNRRGGGGVVNPKTDLNFVKMMGDVLKDKLRTAETMYAGPLDVVKHNKAYELPADHEDAYKAEIEQYRTAIAWVKKFIKTDNSTRTTMWDAMVTNHNNTQLSDVQKRILNAGHDVINDGYDPATSRPRPEKSWWPATKDFFSSRRWTPDQVSAQKIAAVDNPQTHAVVPIAGSVPKTTLEVDPRQLAGNPDASVPQYEVELTKTVERNIVGHPDKDLNIIVRDAFSKALQQTTDWARTAQQNGNMTQQELSATLDMLRQYHNQVFSDQKTRIQKLKEPGGWYKVLDHPKLFGGSHFGLSDVVSKGMLGALIYYAHQNYMLALEKAQQSGLPSNTTGHL